jgi:Bacterial membrane protein YfhO
MRDKRNDGIALFAIAILLVVWFAPVLFTGRTFFIKDILRYHFSTNTVVRAALRSGEFAWNPFHGSGQPLAANPADELFYPGQWLVLAGDFPHALTLQVLLHALAAAIGMYALLRSFRLGAPSAAFGAIAFTLGGGWLSLVRTLPYLYAMTWVPLIALFARRWLIARGRRDFVLAALFGGIQALIAEPTTLMQTWALVGAYALYRGLREKKRLWTNLAGAVLMGVCAALVAMAQLLPALDHARDSVRSRPLDYETVSFASMAPTRPLELLYPSIFQSTLTSAGVPSIRTMYPNGEPFIANLYLGVATAILFLAGLFAWKRGSGLVLAVCAISYIVAAGAHTPLLRILYDLGIFRSIRYPEKFVLAMLVTMIVWAAITLDRLARGDADVAKWALRITIGWLALALLQMLFSFNIGAEIGFWLRTLLRGAAVLVVVLLMRKRPSPVWAIALVAVTLADVYYLQAEVNPTMPARLFDAPAAAAELAPQKDAYRVFHTADWDWAYGDPRAEAYFGSAYGPWWFIRNGMMPRTPAGWGFRSALEADYAEVYLLPTADLTTAMRSLRESGRHGWEPTLMSMANAWYSSAFRPFAAEEKRTGGDPEKMQPVDFVAAPVRTPRFYFADQIEQAGSIEMFVSKMLAKSWSPRVAFVETPPFTPAAGTVRRATETWHSALLDVDSTGRALLVISITPHKYWRATIDGRPATLQVANIGYQALEVPAGHHTIALTYRNPLIPIGILVSLLALVAIIAIFFLSPRVAIPEPVVVTEPPKPQKTRQSKSRSKR